MGWLIGGKKYQRLQAEVSRPGLFYLEFIEKYTDYMEKNYYIEAQTRDQKRTDIIVDFHGTQHIRLSLHQYIVILDIFSYLETSLLQTVLSRSGTS